MDDVKEDDPLLDTDEEDEDFIPDDDDDDEDDEDFVPDGHSDSDPDYGSKKRKRTSSASSSPKKRTRSSSSSVKKSPGRKRKSTSKSPAKKTPAKKSAKKKKTTRSSSKAAPLSPSIRRSSRSTRARAVSYADADVSEEEYLQDLEPSSGSEDELKQIKKEKRKSVRKKHVDDLWSSFKADTAAGSKNKEQEEEKKEKEKEEEKNNIDEENETKKMVEECKNSEEPSSKEKSPKDTDNSKDKEKDCSQETTKSNEESTSYAKVEIAESKDEEAKKEKEECSKEECSKEECSKEEGKVYKKTESCSQSDETVKSKKIEKIETDTKADTTPTITETTAAKPTTELTSSTESTTHKPTTSSTATTTNNNEAKAVPSKPAATSSSLPKGLGAFQKGGGLSSLVGNMKDKKKTSILDQSKNDWNSFKNDEGLEDELRANRSAGYLDKQEFLQRVDYNQWENEREMRLYTNRK